MKIEHVGASVVAPRWDFVLQEDQPLVGPLLDPIQKAVPFLEGKVGAGITYHKQVGFSFSLRTHNFECLASPPYKFIHINLTKSSGLPM